MEAHQLLSTLRRHKLATLILILAALAAAAATPKLAPSSPGGQATAQLLVDSASDILSTTHARAAPLATRAELLAQIMNSDALLALTAKDAGVPRSEITSEGPYNAPALALNAVTPSEARGPQLLSNFVPYRLTILPQPGNPIVSVMAQGPTPPLAANIVTAMIAATRQYLVQLAQAEHIAHPQIAVRQMGPAQEGAIGGGRKMLMAVTALSVLLLGLLLLLLVEALARRRGEEDHGTGWPELVAVRDS